MTQEEKAYMKKFNKFWTVALIGLLMAGVLAACGDNTATSVPVATTAAATTAAAGATTAAAGATTAAAGTTAAKTTAAAGATTAAAGATTAAASGAGGTIRIYSSLPQTGGSADQVKTMVQAAKLALDDFTAGTNKIGNFTIEYVPLDDATAAKGQWDPDQEKTNANKAVNDPDAMVYLGTFNSGAAKVSIPILNPANIAMISPANTYPGLTKSVTGQTEANEPGVYYKADQPRNYFRLVATDDLQGAAIVEYLKSANAKKVYVIDDSQAYGKGLAEGVKLACKPAGIDCSLTASITGKESNYTSLAADVKAKGADGVVFAGIIEQNADKVVSDIRSSGFKGPIAGGDGIQLDAFIKGAGAAAEGVAATIPGQALPYTKGKYDPAKGAKLTQKAQDFYQKYQAKYGKPEAYTIYGYEMMSVALNAIKTAGVKDRKAILTAIANTKDFDGLLGKWSFDKNGDTSLPDLTVYQVQEGIWESLTTVRPKLS